MQLKYTATTCPFCGTGCGLNLIATDAGISGVAPYHRSTVNRGKLCTRGLHTAKAIADFRIEKASIKGAEATLDAAIAEAKKLSGAEVYVSSRLTNEAIYAVKRMATEVLGAKEVKTFTDVNAKSDAKLADIAAADVIVVVDDCMKKLPVVGGTILRAQDKGAKVLYAGPAGYTSVQADQTAETADAFAEAVKGAKAAVVVAMAGSPLAADAEKFAAANKAKFALLFETNNGKGAALLGCVPSLSAFKAAEAPKSMLIFAESPEVDAELYADLLPILEKVENLVVVAANASVLTDIATVVIPMASFAQYAGTFTNWEGRVQLVRPAAEPAEGIPTPYELVKLISDGKIAYENAEAIYADIKANVKAFAAAEPAVDGPYVQEA
ncbi:MAG TPA: hypothetical protein O0X19_04940 [Methanocorpusculum sp.]|nr:hypothetical protein [Methanocorpusculum sp.]HJJ33703.1 hypothetical protein [Methanocorpusculum sp.]HJJ44553.1 hypothetical protein [Methanocorpusculum sp.]